MFFKYYKNRGDDSDNGHKTDTSCNVNTVTTSHIKNVKSTSPSMQNTHTHTHTLLFGSKFHLMLAMYAQMLDIYTVSQENVPLIFFK